jgi:hypothetical protein
MRLLGAMFAGLGVGFTGTSFILYAGPVLAQAVTALPPAAPTGGIDFAPLAMNVIAAGVTIASIAAGIVSRFVISFLSSKIHMQDSAAEKLASDRVNDILFRAIDYAEAWSKTQVGDPNSQIRHVKIDNFFLGKAVEYSISAMPDLIKLFGLTREKLEAMIVSRLNAIMPVPPANSGTPMTTANLAAPDPVKAAASVAETKASSDRLEDTKDAMGPPSHTV